MKAKVEIGIKMDADRKARIKFNMNTYQSEINTIDRQMQELTARRNILRDRVISLGKRIIDEE